MSDILHLGDLSQFREASADSYTVLLDEGMTFSQQITKLINSFVLLPYADLQVPILASFITAFTPVCTRLPICFCVGAAGSGKSTIGVLASHIQNSSILNASATPASVRNHAVKLRFGDDREDSEKTYLLIWDDVKSHNFLDYPVIYAILRGGYDRSTDQVTIANSDGTNITFRVFGGRLTSSIEAVYNHPKLSELQRRVLPFMFKKWGSFTPQEQSSALLVDNNFDISDKPDPNDFSWEGLHQVFLNQWNLDAMATFATLKKKLNSNKRLKSLLGGKLSLVKEIICSGVTLGFFGSLDDACETFSSYWEVVAKTQFQELSATAQAIQQITENLTMQAEQINQKAGALVVPLEISPKVLQTEIQARRSNGELDSFATPGEIHSIMRQLGYQLSYPQGSSDNRLAVWKKVTN